MRHLLDTKTLTREEALKVLFSVYQPTEDGRSTASQLRLRQRPLARAAAAR